MGIWRDCVECSDDQMFRAMAVDSYVRSIVFVYFISTCALGSPGLLPSSCSIITYDTFIAHNLASY